MSFKINANPEFSRTVRVLVPEGDGHVEHTFEARFRVVDETDDNELVSRDGMKSFLREAIVSFDDIVGTDNQPMSYSEELRDQMLARSYVRLALMSTYSTAVTKLREGN